MDADDLELFERTIQHNVASTTGAALDDALHDLGWLDALADDDQAAVSILFTHQGRAHATSAALDHLLARSLSDGGSAGAEGGVALPALGATAPPGRLDGDQLSVRGLGTSRLTREGTTLIPTAIDDRVIGVEVPTASLILRTVEGIDPSLGLIEVTGHVAGDGAGVDAGAAPELLWERGVAVAQLAIGHELIGASRTMLEQAREHALERVQFGQPISGFQAIRHRMAETLIAIESAEAVLSGAWEDRSPTTAAMAKAMAGRAARTSARHCQQVLAGIGFTTEHPLHHSIRRVLVLDELFGSSRTLTADLGREILATRQLPPLLPL
jgi:hypothetical protein